MDSRPRCRLRHSPCSCADRVIMASLQNLTILGSTGSVGANTLDGVERYPDRFGLVGVTAHGPAGMWFDQCVRHGPRYAVISQPRLAEELQQRLSREGLETEVL